MSNLATPHRLMTTTREMMRNPVWATGMASLWLRHQRDDVTLPNRPACHLFGTGCGPKVLCTTKEMMHHIYHIYCKR